MPLQAEPSTKILICFPYLFGVLVVYCVSDFSDSFSSYSTRDGFYSGNILSHGYPLLIAGSDDLCNWSILTCIRYDANTVFCHLQQFFWCYTCQNPCNAVANMILLSNVRYTDKYTGGLEHNNMPQFPADNSTQHGHNPKGPILADCLYLL